jgi:hypothetical protein
VFVRVTVVGPMFVAGGDIRWEIANNTGVWRREIISR